VIYSHCQYLFGSDIVGKRRRCLLCLILVLAFAPPALHTTAGKTWPLLQQSNTHQDVDEILTLLSKLRHRHKDDGSGKVTTEGPTLEVQKEVPRRLIEIANQSPEARCRVIQALMREVDNPDEEVSLVATGWINAVGLLGKLKAIEAVDFLVKNICETGSAILVSIHFRPTFSAVINIGEPAIPRLTEALLSDERPHVRREAAWALVEIGGQQAKAALELGVTAELDEDVRKEVRRALTCLTEFLYYKSNRKRPVIGDGLPAVVDRSSNEPCPPGN
jgi:hypothetical protein